MKEFIEYIVKQLVDQPEDVKVTEVTGQHVTVFELHVAKSDMGKVIGKAGQNASALRTLVTAASAAKGGSRCILEILE